MSNRLTWRYLARVAVRRGRTASRNNPTTANITLGAAPRDPAPRARTRACRPDRTCQPRLAAPYGAIPPSLPALPLAERATLRPVRPSRSSCTRSETRPAGPAISTRLCLTWNAGRRVLSPHRSISGSHSAGPSPHCGCISPGMAQHRRRVLRRRTVTYPRDQIERQAGRRADSAALHTRDISARESACRPRRMLGSS